MRETFEEVRDEDSVKSEKSNNLPRDHREVKKLQIIKHSIWHEIAQVIQKHILLKYMAYVCLDNQ